MSDGKNHRRKERKRKGEKPPHCECACHSMLLNKMHTKPCCYPKNTWWIMGFDDIEGCEIWVKHDPL